MKKKKILWKDTGWTVLQEADAAKHVLEISARAEMGKVVEVRIRHNDGEERKGNVYLDGANALPMAFEDFKEKFTAGVLEIK